MDEGHSSECQSRHINHDSYDMRSPHVHVQLDKTETVSENGECGLYRSKSSYLRRYHVPSVPLVQSLYLSTKWEQ